MTDLFANDPVEKAMTDHLAPLVGAVVEQAYGYVTGGIGEPHPWPVLVLRQPDGERIIVEVASDAEWNGPGHLVIRPFD